MHELSIEKTEFLIWFSLLQLTNWTVKSQ